MKMGIVTFSVESRIFKFKEPLMLEQENVEGVLCLTHKELCLSACGESYSECESGIRDELALLWDDYALAPDDELTADAIALKNKLLAMAEEAK
jgi:hypothetical protein